MSIEALLKKAAVPGASAKDIVQEAISSPQLYTFGELLELPLLQSAPAETLAVLECFAYGTWRDYGAKKLPALDANAARKLKHLTVVTLAARHGKELSYDVLKKELELESLRELEDLVLDAIYQGLIEGKIDQQKQRVYVDFAIGRDVREGDLLRVQEVLANWVARSGTLIKSIEDKIAVARTEIKAEQMHREDFDRRVKEIKENLRAIMEAQEADQRMMGKRVGGAAAAVGGGGAGAGGRRDPRAGGAGGMHAGFFK